MTENAKEKDESLIPCGMYCYETSTNDAMFDEHGFKNAVKVCPYWSIDPDKPKQMNGYCSYIELGDWDLPAGFALIWDQVKACGINEEDII